MADYLAKTHTDVLIADRVGTGVGIASGALVIGGLIAAPFTAGLSLGLTIAGTTTGVLGGITSAGANITGYVISKQSLASLEEELKGHITNLESLYSSNSRYLLYAARFRHCHHVIIDVIHMVQICQETGETPTVQQLRKMADDLDKEI